MPSNVLDMPRFHSICPLTCGLWAMSCIIIGALWLESGGSNSAKTLRVRKTGIFEHAGRFFLFLSGAP